MRVTDRQQTQALLTAVQNIRQGIFDRQEQISSGKRVNRPSDDPAAAERISQFKNTLQTTDRRLFSVNEGIGRLSVSESTFATVGNAIQRGRELAIQARNDTNSDVERANIGKEVNQLFQSLSGLANTQLNGRSIFAGHETQVDPYVLGSVNTSLGANNAGSGTVSGVVSTAAALEPHLYEIQYNGTNFDVLNLTTGETEVSGGGSPLAFDGLTVTMGGVPSAGDVFYARSGYTYQGDSNDVAVEIGDGKTVSSNVAGNRVFSGPTVDLFTVFQDFHQALATNDVDGIETAIATLDTALSQVNNARADVGARVNRLDTVKESLSLVHLTIDSLRSDYEDADFAKVATELSSLQVNLQASLSVLTRQFETSLLNFLR
ncbi:MAG: flagellar hook-associated protein FlgL [Nitrospirales bacterium]|nr:MAG: flagellar hook-associated protein FlgL [Nitrospirales bacterium]